jgi:hypothetical protein
LGPTLRQDLSYLLVLCFLSVYSLFKEGFSVAFHTYIDFILITLALYLHFKNTYITLSLSIVIVLYTRMPEFISSLYL